MRKYGFIEDFGLFASLIVSMIGGGIFYVPAVIANYIGYNGWIAVIIGGLILYIIYILIAKLNEAGRYKMLNSILENDYGAFIGKILSLSYSISVIVVISLSLRVFAEVISIYLLSNTPTEVILITMLFMGCYLSRGGLANVVHFNEIIFWIMFIPIALILILTLPQADFSNLLPVGGFTVSSYVGAVLEMLFIFNGFSMAFILIPYVKNRARIKKIALKSAVFITIFYTAVFVLVYATLSSPQTSDSIFPTITMLQSINSKSGILEKWDTLIMALWVLYFFTSFANLYYFASITLKKATGLHDIRTSSMIYVPITYLIAMMPRNVIGITNLQYAGIRIIYICIVIVFIILTLIISFSKRRAKHEG